MKVQFYPGEHPPAHFYAEYRALAHLPAERRAVLKWVSSRQALLLATFVKATSKQKLDPLCDRPPPPHRLGRDRHIRTTS